MKGNSQLCWKCSKTNSIDCKWFKTHKKQSYFKVNNKGFIYECDNFELDKMYKDPESLLTVAEMAKALGISARTFYRNKKYYLTLYRNLINENKS